MPGARLHARFLLCFFCFFCLLCLFPLKGSEAPSLSLPTAAAEPPSPLRFAVIGDSGSGDENQRLIARRMAEWHAKLPFGLVLMLGDNVYGGLLGWGGGNQKDFPEKFDRPYAELLGRGVIFRAALGNHDLRHRDGLDLVESYDRFHIERPDGYYSFTAGTWHPAAGAAGLNEKGGTVPLVEFFVLNTVRLEKNKKDPEQLEWLERALGASRARWRIVYGHHPLHSTGRRHGPDERMRAKLEPLFFASDQPRVHVALAGHDHIYQRF